MKEVEAMSRCVLYRKEEYIIVRNGNGNKVYYTVINTKLNTHIHINTGIKLCKIIINRAVNRDISKCSLFIKNKVLILLGKNHDWNISHTKVKESTHNHY